jgi:hypothetical protein
VLHDSWHHPSHEPDAHSEPEVQGSPTPAKPPQKLGLIQAPSGCPVTGTQQLLTQSPSIAHFAWQRPVCSMQKAPSETPVPDWQHWLSSVQVLPGDLQLPPVPAVPPALRSSSGFG